MNAPSGGDANDTSDEEQQHLMAQHQQHQQENPSSVGQRSQLEFGGEKEDRKPYDHVMGWNTTDFLSKSIRAGNVLSISDSSLGKVWL